MREISQCFCVCQAVLLRNEAPDPFENGMSLALSVQSAQTEGNLSHASVPRGTWVTSHQAGGTLRQAGPMALFESTKEFAAVPGMHFTCEVCYQLR